MERKRIWGGREEPLQGVGSKGIAVTRGSRRSSDERIVRNKSQGGGGIGQMTMNRRGCPMNLRVAFE